MSWAIVRVRGTVNVKSKISKTLKFLRLRRPNHCIIVPENDSYKGMLNIVKDYVTWGEITPASVEMLAKDRIHLEGGNVVSTAELKSLGFKNVKDFAKQISEGKVHLNNMRKIKPVIRLHPPIKGYEGNKRSYKEGGSLGYRGEEINNLIGRMCYASK